MYCKHCGRLVDDNYSYCTNCGMRFDDIQNNNTDDLPNFGFALLGFFIPLIGLILFLIYESKKPKRAKSAGTGALIGFITKTVLSIIFVIVYFAFVFFAVDNIKNDIDSDVPVFDNMLNGENTEDILEKYTDVTFGEFKISNNGYFYETSLDVTVKNKADSRYTYYITIEAVDDSGARLGTDIIYADRLNSGQEIHLAAFEYVEQEKIEQFKNATFKVLEINKYN